MDWNKKNDMDIFGNWILDLIECEEPPERVEKGTGLFKGRERPLGATSLNDISD
jgi:hypothetical protein